MRFVEEPDTAGRYAASIRGNYLANTCVRLPSNRYSLGSIMPSESSQGGKHARYLDDTERRSEEPEPKRPRTIEKANTRERYAALSRGGYTPDTYYSLPSTRTSPGSSTLQAQQRRTFANVASARLTFIPAEQQLEGLTDKQRQALNPVLRLRRTDMPQSYEEFYNFRKNPIEQLFHVEHTMAAAQQNDYVLGLAEMFPNGKGHPDKQAEKPTQADVLARAYAFTYVLEIRHTNDVFRRRIMNVFWWDMYCKSYAPLPGPVQPTISTNRSPPRENGPAILHVRVERMLRCIRTVISSHNTMRDAAREEMVWTSAVQSAMKWIEAGKKLLQFVTSLSLPPVGTETPDSRMHFGVLFFLPSITDAFLKNNWSRSGKVHDAMVQWLREEVGLVEAASASGADTVALAVRKHLIEGFQQDVWFGTQC